MPMRKSVKDARRKRIVRAARKLIQETGDEGFTMQQLADAAGVSLMTPYNLFGSKQNLIIWVLDDDVFRFSEMLEQVRADPLDTLVQSVSVARRLYETDPDFYRAALGVALGATPQERAYFLKPRASLWRELIQNAIDSGQLVPLLDIDAVARSIGYVFYSGITFWLAGEMNLRQFEAHVSQGVALILLGLAAPERRDELMKIINACPKTARGGCRRLANAPPTVRSVARRRRTRLTRPHWPRLLPVSLPDSQGLSDRKIGTRYNY